MLDRHDLVRLAPEGWDQALAGLSGAAAALAADWRARDLPAVARRLEPGTPPAMVCLGMPAPPDPHTGQKLRVGLKVRRGSIVAIRPPLALHEAEVPAPWQPAFAELRDAMSGAGIECRVFGSVAMQTITGERYLGPASDIDLLLRPSSAAQLDAGLDLLVRYARHLPLDGEIAFPSAQAVSWKEWLAAAQPERHGGARVLTKHLDTVALVRCDALLGQFGGGAHG